jgi:hypothetical protein
MISQNNYIKTGNLVLYLELKLLSEYRGKRCPKCGLIQGLPNDKLGVHIWYCDWVYKKVNKKLKKIKERISEKILIDSFNDLNYSDIS